MVRVKICGITSWEDAKLAVDEGASALGFNFYPPSPRVISPYVAWDILRRLPPYVDRIGVYVDWQPKVIAALTRALRLTGIQLHGNESAGEVEELSVKAPVVKAFPVKRDFDPESLRKFSACFRNFTRTLRSGVARRRGQAVGLGLGARSGPVCANRACRRFDARKRRGSDRRLPSRTPSTWPPVLKSRSGKRIRVSCVRLCAQLSSANSKLAGASRSLQ